MMRNWIRALTLAGLGLTVAVGGALAQDRDSDRDRDSERSERDSGRSDRDIDRDRSDRDGERGRRGMERAGGDLPGPIDNPRDLQDTARMLFTMADTNHDGEISKREATNAGNRVVGGFFFEADANGDGTLTQEEARDVRQQFMNRQPIVRLLIQEARRQRSGNDSQPNPFQGLASLVDANNDQKIQASEVRRTVQSAVDGLYTEADTNRDGQLSAGEVNAAALGMVRAAGGAAFRNADKDGNGSVSREEFEQALVEPARVFFGAVDTDNDDQISEEEARRAQNYIMRRASRLRGPRGDDDAPVPSFNFPGPGSEDEGRDADDGRRATRPRPVRRPVGTAVPAPGTVAPAPGTVAPVPGTVVPGTTPAPATIP